MWEAERSAGKTHVRFIENIYIGDIAVDECACKLVQRERIGYDVEPECYVREGDRD